MTSGRPVVSNSGVESPNAIGGGSAASRAEIGVGGQTGTRRAAGARPASTATLVAGATNEVPFAFPAGHAGVWAGAGGRIAASASASVAGISGSPAQVGGVPQSCTGTALKFGIPPLTEVNETPNSIASFDINGDGKLDLVIPNRTPDNVSVLLGKGDGSFLPKVDYAAGLEPIQVAVGDLNGDGSLDLVTANRESNSLSVLLGTGEGRFDTKSDIAGGKAPVAVAIGDLDRDGNLDLVAANRDANTVSVIMGKGGGKFGTKTDFPTGAMPRAVALSDLDGDGKLDVVTASMKSGSLSVLVGKGDGKLTEKADYTTNAVSASSGFAGANPYSVVVGDINGDQLPDLVAATVYSQNAKMKIGPSVTALIGPGAGAFAIGVTYPTGIENDCTLSNCENIPAETPNAVALGDLDGDRNPDLVAVNSDAGTVGVLLSKGDGSFLSKVEYPAGGRPTAVAIGDYDGDSKLDLAIANQFPDTIAMLFGKGDGTFASTETYTAPYGFEVNWIAHGDVNRDGVQDLAVGTGSQPFVMLGKSDGTFSPAPTSHSAWMMSSWVDLADLNGDGRLDLAVAENDKLGTFLGSGDGAFGSAVTSTDGMADGWNWCRLGDLNADGKIDLVTVSATGRVSTRIGNGDGTFSSRVDYSGGDAVRTFELRDLDSDGNPDVLLGSPDSISVLAGKGDGKLLGMRELLGTHGVTSEDSKILLVDLNRDDRLDIVTNDPGSGAIGVR